MEDNMKTIYWITHWTKYLREIYIEIYWIIHKTVYLREIYREIHFYCWTSLSHFFTYDFDEIVDSNEIIFYTKFTLDILEKLKVN